MTQDVDLALLLAEKWHAGQKYGTHPYTYHLREVYESVKEAAPNDERLHIVAVLHDILEDTAISAALLHSLFEDKVVDAVFALTKGDGESSADYLGRVKDNPLALIVKRHDALANLRNSLMRGDLRRVNKYASVLAELTK